MFHVLIVILFLKKPETSTNLFRHSGVFINERWKYIFPNCVWEIKTAPTKSLTMNKT